MTDKKYERCPSKGYSLPDETLVRETYRPGETIISIYPPPSSKVGGAGALMMIRQSFLRRIRGLEQKIES